LRAADAGEHPRGRDQLGLSGIGDARAPALGAERGRESEGEGEHERRGEHGERRRIDREELLSASRPAIKLEQRRPRLGEGTARR